MGSKTLKAHYDYYLIIFNITIPGKGLLLNSQYLQQLQYLYEKMLQLHPNGLSLVHQATHQAAMVLQQQILELNKDLKFPKAEPKHHDRQQTRAWYPRFKRGVDISFDGNAMINSLFSGIYSIFYLHSISEVRKGLRNQAKRLNKLSQFTVDYARKTNSLLHQLADQVNNLENQFQAVTTDLKFIILDLYVLI